MSTIELTKNIEAQLAYFSHESKPVLDKIKNLLIRFDLTIQDTNDGVVIVESNESSELENHFDKIHLEREFLVFDQVVSLIGATSNLPDEEFRKDVIPEIRQLLKYSRIFQIMDEGRSGREISAFEHTIDVLAKLKTYEGSSDDIRAFSRISAIFHDVGKFVLKEGDSDEFQYHAAISYWIFKTYLFSRKDSYDLSDDGVSSVLDVIRLHHAPQMVETGYLNLKSVQQLVEGFPPHAKLLFAELVVADVASSHPKFLPANVHAVLEICFKLSDAEIDFSRSADNIAFLLVAMLKENMITPMDIRTLALSIIGKSAYLLDRMAEETNEFKMLQALMTSIIHMNLLAIGNAEWETLFIGGHESDIVVGEGGIVYNGQVFPYENAIPVYAQI